MTMKHWMLAVVSTGLLAGSILAQAPPVIPADQVPAPPAPRQNAKSGANKPRPAATKKTSPTAGKAAEPVKTPASISPGPAVAKEKNVNVRGQAAINSEIVTHLKRGDLVTVLEEVTLKKPKTDEPAKWAKIALPPGTVVWVNALFIKPDTKAVIPRRLNLRSGPGENYSILGRIERGTVVKEVETKGDWIKIEAPKNSYAFVAAHLLSTDPADLGPALAKANPPAPPVVTPPPVETVAITAPTPPPTRAEPITLPPVVVPPPPPPTETAIAQSTPPPTPAPPVEVEETLVKRIVTREGIVKGAASIQSPTYFVLRSLDNNKTINYLHSPNTNFVIREFHLQRVLVTGEEVLDERWPNTPVINVDSIEAVP
jgi:SH3-like domain-containing protein